MEDNKVFCSNCIWYSYYAHLTDEEECHTKENKKEIINYHSKSFKLLNKPYKLNKNNDCKYYGQKY